MGKSAHLSLRKALSPGVSRIHSLLKRGYAQFVLGRQLPPSHLAVESISRKRFILLGVVHTKAISIGEDSEIAKSGHTPWRFTVIERCRRTFLPRGNNDQMFPTVEGKYMSKQTHGHVLHQSVEAHSERLRGVKIAICSIHHRVVSLRRNS